jgi:hypothetical protein
MYVKFTDSGIFVAYIGKNVHRNFISVQVFPYLLNVKGSHVNIIFSENIQYLYHNHFT